MLEGIAAQLVETDAEYLRVIYFALAQKKTFGEESSTQSLGIFLVGLGPTMNDLYLVSSSILL